MEELKAVLAENIIALRAKAGLTQVELGEMLNYSDKSISKWERGESIPDAYVLKQMSGIFGVTVDYLLSPHEEGEELPAALRALAKNHSRQVVTAIAAMGIWTIAVLAFVVVWICGSMEWLIFAYAVPVTLVTLLALNSAWHIRRMNVYLVSLLIWSVIAVIYLTFWRFNWWQLFLLGVPAEVVVILSFRVRLNKKQ